MSMFSDWANSPGGSKIWDPLDLGGARSGAAADKAMDFQSKMTKRAMAQLMKMWETGRGDLAPFREAGGDALGRINHLLEGGFNPEDPAFQFRMKMGQEGVLKNAGATGSPWSGGAMKDLTAFNQGLTSNTMQEQLNPLLQVANLGEAAAAGSASGAMGTGGAMSDALTAMGNAGGANALWGYQQNQQAMNNGMQLAGMLASFFA